MSIFLLLLLPLLGGDAPARADSLVVSATATACDVDLYGRIVLADARASTVTLFAADGTLQRSTGGTGWGNDQFDAPAAVWMRNGIDIFVADYNNHRIQRFDRNLNFVSSLSTRDNAEQDERFGYPTDVALSRMGDLFVCDTENSRIVKFNGLSRVDRSFGGIASGRGRLRRPRQIEIGPSDRVYVLDAGGVQIFDGFGNFLKTIADSSFNEKTMISADQNGLVVLAGSDIRFFDRSDTPAGSLALSGLDADASAATALTVHDGDLYLLTRSGVHLLAGVRESILTK
jgi:DNA-binding beta-propeller fold protein YncE